MDTAWPASYYSLDIHRHDLSVSASQDHSCSEVVSAAELYCHAEYSKATMDGDICLIRLSSMPRCASDLILPQLDVGDAAASGALATVAGWVRCPTMAYTLPRLTGCITCTCG